MSAQEAQSGDARKQKSLMYFQSKKVLEKSREVLKLFSAAKKSASIYPAHHELCIRATGDFMRAFEEYLEWHDEFSLRIIGDEFFFEEKLMARESVLYYPLIKELQAKDVGGLNLLRGLNEEEFMDFLYLLNRKSDELAASGGLASLMAAKGISHISLDDPGTWEEKSREERLRSSARDEYFDAVDVIREMADQVMNDRRLSVNHANRVVGAMLNRVGEDRSAILGLATIKSYDEYTSYHSVNVLLLSLALGSMLPLDRSALMILGTGALLHDLGKVTVPQLILKKTGPLTSSEWRIMQDHPVKGADILLAQPGIHPLSVMIAYEHHSRYDLAGYPKISGKTKPGLFSRIVEVADVYDAMTSTRPYQNARPPDQAIRVLAKDMGTAFDPLLVKVFIDMLGFFPVGTPVRLATGELGIVYEQNEGDAMCPKVKLIRDAEDNEVEPQIVDTIYLKEKFGELGSSILESVNAKNLGIDTLPYL